MCDKSIVVYGIWDDRIFIGCMLDVRNLGMGFVYFGRRDVE